MKKLMIIIGIYSIFNINVLEGKMSKEILETSRIGQEKYQRTFDSKIFDTKTYIAKNNLESFNETVSKKETKIQIFNKTNTPKSMKEILLENKTFDISMEEFQNTKKEIEILKSDDNKIKIYIKNKMK